MVWGICPQVISTNFCIPKKTTLKLCNLSNKLPKRANFFTVRRENLTLMMRSTLVSPPPEANRRVNHGRICPPPPQSSPNWNLLPNNGPYKAHWIKFSTFALLVNAVQTIVADAGKAIVDALHEQRMPTWEERAAFLAYWDYAS